MYLLFLGCNATNLPSGLDSCTAAMRSATSGVKSNIEWWARQESNLLLGSSPERPLIKRPEKTILPTPVLNFLIMRLLLVASLLIAQDAGKPRLETRAHPVIQTVDISVGCSNVQLIAEIKGPESENWYCPQVSWEMPDGTRAVEESDCPPFEMRDSCYPPQGPECGWKGFYLDRETGKYVDIVKYCPCTIYGYQRIWRRSVCAPSHPQGLEWTVLVRLKKNDRTFAYSEIRFFVK